MAKTLTALMVGCGGMSGTWLRAAGNIPGLKIIGLVDLVEQAAKNRKAEFNLQEAITSTNLRQTLKRSNPDIVFDCSIPSAHTKVTIEALNHGCHVLGEKPLADSMRNARRMIAAARKAGKLYAVIQNRRYIQQVRRFQEFLQTSKIGELTTLDSDFYIGAHFGGFRAAMDHPLVLDMAIHTFDMARFLSAADPVSVYCHEWNPKASWYSHGASAVAIFEMSNNLIYTYRGSWCSEGLNTSWQGCWRAVGTKGSACWDGENNMKAQVAEENQKLIWNFKDLEIPDVKTNKVGGHEGIIREFVDCVRRNKVPETLCTDNVKSLAMVFGAIESAEKGEKIKIKC